VTGAQRRSGRERSRSRREKEALQAPRHVTTAHPVVHDALTPLGVEAIVGHAVYALFSDASSLGRLERLCVTAFALGGIGLCVSPPHRC
jgi:hypothetical protein